MLKFLFKLLIVFAIFLPIIFFVFPRTQTANAILPGECNDGEDNDFDGKIDGSDPDCTSPSDLSEGSITYASCNLTYSGSFSIVSGTSPRVTLSNLDPTHYYFVTVATKTNPGIPTYTSASFRGDTDPKTFTIPSSAFPYSDNTYYIKALDTTNVNAPCRYPITISVTSPPSPSPGPSLPPHEQCTLTVDTAFVAKKDVYFTLSNLLSGTTYTVVLYKIDESNVGNPVTQISQTFTGPGVATGFFPGSAIVDFSGIRYDIIAYEGPADINSGLKCVKKLPELVPGENPCKGDICKTALGDIQTQIGPFARKLLAIGVGLAGGIALIIMVIGSIRVLTSAGDPKNVAAGREMIIAAVAGLLFLIFSVLILQFIGFDIIRIPDFIPNVVIPAVP